MIEKILEKLRKLAEDNEYIPVEYDDVEKIIREVAQEYGDGWIPCSESMERLTRRSENGVGVYATPSGDPVKWERNRHRVLQKLADYEDKEEQGLLIELPVAIGSDVYYIPSKANYDLNVLHHHKEFNRVYHQKIARLHFAENVWYAEGDLNLEYGVVDRLFVDRTYKETWFLTEAEAEEALAKMGE